jgi:cysteine-rich repeat protein
MRPSADIVRVPGGIAVISFTADRCIGGTGFGVVWAPWSAVASSACGNGVLEALEACDDNNAADRDGCSADCSSVEIGYVCVGGSPSACAPLCGDGIKAAAEACDDGNAADGDGCSRNCTCETVPCMYTVTAAGHLASVLATAAEGTTIRLTSEAFGDVSRHQPLIVAAHNVSLTAAEPARGRPMLGGPYGFALRVGAGARGVRLVGLRAGPGLRVYVGSGSVVRVSDLVGDHVGIFADNATVDVAGAVLTRRLDTTASLFFRAAGSALAVSRLSLVDRHDGERLVILGSSSSVALAGSELSSLSQSGPCVQVAGDDMRLNVTATNITWCWANYGPGGGAINFIGDRGRLSISGCLITSNGADATSATGGGAVLFQGARGLLDVDRTDLSSNMVLKGNGGTVFCAGADANMRLVGSRVAFGLNINGHGPGLFFNGSAMTVEGCTLLSNRAPRGIGGGFYAVATGAVVVRGTVISQNSAVSGGGVSAVADSVLLTGSALRGNRAGTFGAGLSVRGLSGGGCAVRLEGSEVSGNTASAGPGGGLHVVGCSAAVAASRVERNTASAGGGGAYVDGAGGSLLNVSESNVTLNTAGGLGGGAQLVHTELLATGTAWTGNAAQSGGAVALTGSAPGGWLFRGGALSSNSAAQQGGAVHLYAPLHTLSVLATGLGAPFALSPDGGRAYSRGQGLLGDHDVYRAGPGGGAPVRILPLGIVQIVVAVSLDETVAVVLRGGEADAARGHLVALAMPSGDALGDEVAVTKVSTVGLTYVASVAFANEKDEMVPSYGLSQAVSARYLVASTFYSVAAWDVAAGRMRLLTDACAVGAYTAAYASGVSALALAPGNSTTLYLVRYENDVNALRVWTVDLQTGKCSRPGWATPPAFTQTRALGVSGDGLFLYVAEKVAVVGSDEDLHQIKQVSLGSGAGSLLTVRSPDGAIAPYLFKSVVAMVQGGDGSLVVLGMAAGNVPSWQKWLRGPLYDWVLWRAGSGPLRLESVAMASNSAGGDGGAVNLEQVPGRSPPPPSLPSPPLHCHGGGCAHTPTPPLHPPHHRSLFWSNGPQNSSCSCMIS